MMLSQMINPVVWVKFVVFKIKGPSSSSFAAAASLSSLSCFSSLSSDSYLSSTVYNNNVLFLSAVSPN